MQSESETPGFGVFALAALLPFVALFVAFAGMSQLDDQVGAIGVSGLIFLSSAMVGALLGFIFAVPRVIAKEGAAAADEGAAAAGEGGNAKVLSTNTNLERISDWLTTMLVGVGLSQLTNLNGVFFQFRIFLAETATVYVDHGHRSAGVLPAIGPFILVLGAASGFLFMYLITRLGLVRFFRKSEDVLSGVAVAAIRVAVTQPQIAPEGPPPTGPGPAASADGADGDVPPTAQPEAGGISSLPQSPATAATILRASQATTLSNDDALEVMFSLLYESGGYRRVIQMSGELSRTPIVKRADYWFYLAAAFGQQMHHSIAESDEWNSARDNALDAAQRAVSIDKSFRGRLWEISNPHSTDNDLAPLRDNPDFRRLVRR